MEIEIPAHRLYHKANWDQFTQILRDSHINIPSELTECKLDKIVNKLNNTLNKALDNSCPVAKARSIDPATACDHFLLNDRIFSRLEFHNFKLKLSKLKLFQHEPTTLGVKIDKNGLTIDPKRIDEILATPLPKRDARLLWIPQQYRPIHKQPAVSSTRHPFRINFRQNTFQGE